MKKLAHTLPYDLLLLEGTQSGKPLPANRWSAATPQTMVAVGAKSEPFFHSGAKALSRVLPSAEYRSLEGLDHSSPLMAAERLAAAVRRFFAGV
jgi:hypothetical protein